MLGSVCISSIKMGFQLVLTLQTPCEIQHSSTLAPRKNYNNLPVTHSIKQSGSGKKNKEVIAFTIFTYYKNNMETDISAFNNYIFSGNPVSIQ